MRRQGFSRDRRARAASDRYERSAVHAKVDAPAWFLCDFDNADSANSAHLQAVAYVIGATAAEKIIAEYERH